MKISDYLITMFMIAAVFIGVFSFTGTLASEQHFNTNITTSYENTYNKVDELTNHTDELTREIQNISGREDTNFFTGVVDSFRVTKAGVVGSAKITTSSLGIGTTLITDFMKDSGLEESGTQIQGILIGILTVLIIGAILFILLRRKW